MICKKMYSMVFRFVSVCIVFVLISQFVSCNNEQPIEQQETPIFECGDYKYSINESNEAIIVEYIGTEENEIIIPDALDGYNVTVIGNNVFYGKGTLKEVTLPNYIKEIENDAFAYSGLTYINFPDTLKVIGSYAFCGCSNLSSVWLPSGLEVLGSYAFDTCNPNVIVYIYGTALLEHSWTSIDSKTKFIDVSDEGTAQRELFKEQISNNYQEILRLYRLADSLDSQGFAKDSYAKSLVSSNMSDSKLAAYNQACDEAEAFWQQAWEKREEAVSLAEEIEIMGRSLINLRSFILMDCEDAVSQAITFFESKEIDGSIEKYMHPSVRNITENSVKKMLYDIDNCELKKNILIPEWSSSYSYCWFDPQIYGYRYDFVLSATDNGEDVEIYITYVDDAYGYGIYEWKVINKKAN